MASTPQPGIRIIPGDAHLDLADRLAREMGVAVEPAEIDSFADGETHVHIPREIRHSNVVIVQPTCPPVNDHLIGLALLSDAARAAGARRIIALVPYFGYARQDLRDRCGDARSFQVAAKLLASVGVDHLVTLDLHTPALESALAMPATLLHAEKAFLPHIKEWQIPDLVVVSPDAGGLKRAQRYAKALDSPVAAIAKHRPTADAAVPSQVLGDVQNRVCLVVDDMASTGKTLAGAAEALRAAGGRDVCAVITHAVMAPGAIDRLLEAQFSKILTTDSIPVAAGDFFEIVPIAPMLARAVRDLCEGE